MGWRKLIKGGNRINILYCENNIDGTVGGSYYSLLYLVKNLDRERYHPIVIFYTQNALLSEFLDAGAEVYVWEKAKTFTFGSSRSRFCRWFPHLRPIAMLLQKLMNIVNAFILPALVRAWYLKKNRIKLVHLNNSILYNHDWMLAAKLARVKCITHERGINERFSASAKFWARNLDAVICISNAVLENMRERGADFGNLTLIYNGLDPAAIKISVRPDALREAYGISTKDVVVGMIGNIKAWKGQDTLVRAMDKVRRSLPTVRCLLVGGTSSADRAYEQWLHELIDSLGLGKHIIFTGYQRNVGNFIKACDVIVHASTLPEPFGRVILEAMACKKPIIGSRAGAVQEIIEEEQSGLTFPPGDSESLAEALLKVLSDREWMRYLGENGYKRLVDKFHIDRNIEQTQSLYDRILKY